MDKNGAEILEDKAIEAIDTILKSYSKKSQFFLVATAHKQIQSMVRWMEAVDLMEERLLDPELIKNMPPDELRKTIDLLHRKLTDGIAFLRELSEIKLPQSVEDHKKSPTLLQGGSPIFESPQARDRLRNLLTGLVSENVLKPTDGNDSTK